MKTCTKCHKEKPLSEFGFRNIKKGYRRAICKPCAVDADREAKIKPRPIEKRIVKGENSGLAVLTEKDIKEMFRLKYVAGFSQNQIAKIFKITSGQSSNVFTRKSWAHLDISGWMEEFKAEKENA